MKCASWFVLALFVFVPAIAQLASAAIPDSDASRETIRVISWNIEWFPGRSPRAEFAQQEAHTSEVLAFVPSLRPDILLLQEIRDETAAEAIASVIDGVSVHVVSHFQRPESTLSQQLVIASRYTALAAFAEHFTGMAGGQPEPYRGFVFAALESPLGGTLLVYSIHLKSNRGEAEINIAMRESAAEQILGHIEEMAAIYEERGQVQVIVGGDFNLLLEQPAMAHERTLAKFRERGFDWEWKGVPFEKRVTWPARGRFGDASFDHFVTRGLPPDRRSSVIEIPTGALSDHYPVLLEIECP